ncbi:MAG: thiamine phosphate synthase [Vicinamibacterales bacterium]|nr:thiamine phosphate synthase [Vicinamibacterales bacterium]
MAASVPLVPASPLFPSRLYVILDVDALAQADLEPLRFLDACLDAGARVFQLRAKGIGAGAFADLGRAVVARTAETGAVVIINDRVDVALVSGASGAHVGQDDLLPTAARAQLGPEAIIGLSTHTDAQVRAAVTEPVSYIAVGPVFDTATKATGYAAVGPASVARARDLAGPTCPVVAIGGITPANAADVIAAGAAAVAVIGGVVGSDPAVLVKRYLDRLA